jgi:hypothetical protein
MNGEYNAKMYITVTICFVERGTLCFYYDSTTDFLTT